MFKTCGIQVRIEGRTHEQFMDHWINVHAAKSEGVGPEQGLYGYVSNEAVGFITPDDLPKLEILDEVDGIALAYYHFGDKNAPKVMTLMKEAFAYFQKKFGAYPYKNFTLP